MTIIPLSVTKTFKHSYPKIPVSISNSWKCFCNQLKISSIFSTNFNCFFTLFNTLLVVLLLKVHSWKYNNSEQTLILMLYAGGSNMTLYFYNCLLQIMQITVIFAKLLHMSSSTHDPYLRAYALSHSRISKKRIMMFNQTFCGRRLKTSWHSANSSRMKHC